MMKRNGFFIILISVVLSAVASFAVVKCTGNSARKDENPGYVYNKGKAANAPAVNIDIEGRSFPDFTFAAENSVEAVVYVKVLKRENKSREATILDYFFGGPQYAQPRESVNSGSGVILYDNGYIVTNNHVVEGAVDVAVTLNNNRQYKAEVVGADPVTDIALLKIDASNLPVIPMGDSDSLRLGEWVLAIGSPYNLRSTITAGIVSAKGRSLPDMSGEFKIESFIQTDAAVNPGNSGGALVNANGELVGVNTAIASNTGSYTGYSFAVPVTIVKKIVNDIMEYGSVKRAMLGVSMLELTGEVAKEFGIDNDISGVYLPEVMKDGSADRAGIRPGDVITAIDGVKVTKPTQVQEKINSHRPDDNIKISVVRDGKEMSFDVQLLGRDTDSAVGTQGKVKVLGAIVEDASEAQLKKYDIKSGVVVVSVGEGSIMKAGIPEGFIITYVNQTKIENTQDLLSVVSGAQRSVLVEGINPSDGSVSYYAIGLNKK